MTYEVVSILSGGPGFVAPGEFPFRKLNNRNNDHSPCQLYQHALETSKTDIIMYAHDDVTIHDPGWAGKIMSCWDCLMDPDMNLVAVGLGGATGLGNADLYRKPFNIWNMARSGYASNQRDAEVHGERFNGVRRAAVLDAFFMAVRRDWLKSVGGWPTRHLTHHCLDLWLAAISHRCDWETWVVGLDCTHHGGGTSIKPSYEKAKWLQGGTRELDHLIPHTWIANEFRDVLPILL